ncbi:MAG: hypothetical protein AABY22_09455 [Nanoarchaeota archaeon]
MVNEWKRIAKDSLYEEYEKDDKRFLIKKRLKGYKIWFNDAIGLHPIEFKTRQDAMLWATKFMQKN